MDKILRDLEEYLSPLSAESCFRRCLVPPAAYSREVLRLRSKKDNRSCFVHRNNGVDTNSLQSDFDGHSTKVGLEAILKRHTAKSR